ncbi:MAG: TlpA family protein disulfide reductase [Bacteroidales bacterium]|nr:TlpA family protein disulfide reductase [Bacteroidales bacterium]
MKKFLIFLFILAMLMSCQDNTITIKGHVQFTDPDMQMTLFRFKDHTRDTIAVVPVDENQNYSLTATIEEPGVYVLDCGHWDRVNLWAEDEDMTIDFRGRDTAKIIIKNPPFVMIKDSPKNAIMNDMNFNEYRNYQMMIAISQASYAANFASGGDKDALTKKLYDANYDDALAREKYFLERYKGETSTLAVVRTLDPVKDEELINSVLDDIEKAHPGYKPAAEMREEMAIKRENKLRMMEGQPAPLFTCPTPDGKEIGPETFRGKILLIDFWASWCGPCRGEVPNLKECYAKYKDKGVEFLSVSVDKSEDAWRKALEEEGMEWPQALAPKAGAAVMDLYQFSGIPFILLLDQEGTIIAKHLRGEAIGRTIGDLLDGFKPGEREKSEQKDAAQAAAPATMAPATTIAPAAPTAPMGGMVPATPIKKN